MKYLTTKEFNEEWDKFVGNADTVNGLVSALVVEDKSLMLLYVVEEVKSNKIYYSPIHLDRIYGGTRIEVIGVKYVNENPIALIKIPNLRHAKVARTRS